MFTELYHADGTFDWGYQEKRDIGIKEHNQLVQEIERLEDYIEIEDDYYFKKNKKKMKSIKKKGKMSTIKK